MKEGFTVLFFAFGRAPECPSPHYPLTLGTMGYVECPFLACGYMRIFGALTVPRFGPHLRVFL